jgi:hypothetical protein
MTNDKPKLWRHMTAAERCAVLLAQNSVCVAPMRTEVAIWSNPDLICLSDRSDGNMKKKEDEE